MVIILGKNDEDLYDCHRFLRVIDIAKEVFGSERISKDTDLFSFFVSADSKNKSPNPVSFDLYKRIVIIRDPSYFDRALCFAKRCENPHFNEPNIDLERISLKKEYDEHGTKLEACYLGPFHGEALKIYQDSLRRYQEEVGENRKAGIETARRARELARRPK